MLASNPKFAPDSPSNGSAAAPRKTAAAAPSTKRGASKVAYALTATAGVRQLDLIAIGTSLLDVAGRAQDGLKSRRDGPWEITQLRFLGDVIE